MLCSILTSSSSPSNSIVFQVHAAIYGLVTGESSRSFEVWLSVPCSKDGRPFVPVVVVAVEGGVQWRAYY